MIEVVKRRSLWIPGRVNEDWVTAIVDLMKDNYEAVGFLPTGAIREALAMRQVYMQYDNGEWVGYLLRGPLRPYGDVYIRQECIDKSARRYGSGQRCFAKLLSDCVDAKAQSIQLRCAADLDANYFWQSLDFTVAGIDTRPNIRHRNVVRYEMRLWPTLFTESEDQ